jgi:hypothetical protein
LAVDTDLSLQGVVQAGEVWVAEGWISFITNAAGPDFQADFGFTGTLAGGTQQNVCIEEWGDGSGPSAMHFRGQTIDSNSVRTLVNYNFGSAVPNGFLRIQAYFNTATSGDIEFRWAQRTSNANGSYVMIGSYIKYFKQ